jgi:hypothetical protein
VSLLGRKVPVPLSLLLDLQSETAREGDDLVVRLRGETADSARVFDGVRAKWRDGAVEVTVLASLVFWNRGGSTAFDETVRVRAPDGQTTVRYREPDGTTVPLPTGGEDRP